MIALVALGCSCASPEASAESEDEPADRDPVSPATENVPAAAEREAIESETTMPALFLEPALGSELRSLAAERRTIQRIWRRETLPSRTFAMFGVIDQGALTKSTRWFSYRGSGVVHSHGRYWPASTVKLMAAVGALETLHANGLDGGSQIDFLDFDGRFNGTARELYRQCLVVSTNDTYNRLIRIAGFDSLNRSFDRWGLFQTTLQRSYTRPVENAEVRTSPPIFFRHEGRQGQLDGRLGVFADEQCPEEGNCTSLADLLEVMRRVVLHDELREEERFRIPDSDARELRHVLSQGRSRIRPAAEEVFGEHVRVYNKTGTVRGDDRLDHALVVAPGGRRRYLVAVSIPYEETNETLTQLVRVFLEQSRRLPAVTPVQPDLGDLELEIDPEGRLVAQREGESEFRYFVDDALVEEAPLVEANRLYTVSAISNGVPVAHIARIARQRAAPRSRLSATP